MQFRYLVWPDTQKVKYKVELQQAEEPLKPLLMRTSVVFGTAFALGEARLLTWLSIAIQTIQLPRFQTFLKWRKSTTVLLGEAAGPSTLYTTLTAESQANSPSKTHCSYCSSSNHFLNNCANFKQLCKEEEEMWIITTTTPSGWHVQQETPVGTAQSEQLSRVK